jgi:SAM-dependent methyltransferase
MALKHRIKPILRPLGLMLLFTRLKYYYLRLRFYKREKTYLESHKNVAFPPPYMLYIAYGYNYRHYMEDGNRTAAWIYNQFAPYLPEKGTILDWGCGPARITRHLPAYFKNWDVIGTDYDHQTIDWCQAALPELQFKLNELHPPLPLPADSVHAAISISIFTHLSFELHESWKAELIRVLVPGGMLFVTTQGDVFVEQMSKAEAELYRCNQLVIRATGPEGHKIYGAYHPVAFMQTFWSSNFEIIRHIPGSKNGGKPIQDNWILRKKVNG